MEFRLTYEGVLKASGNNQGGRGTHKHAIRKIFHKQLKRLWGIHPYLSQGYPIEFRYDPNVAPYLADVHHTPIADWLADQYNINGYRFVPLVREKLSLICSLNVLFLRPDRPGAMLKSGDIDGRLKTLLDALQMPVKKENLGGYLAPDEDENPFYCLLENDGLITHLSVETDVLLQPTGAQWDVNDSRIVIAVKIRPYDMNPGNMSYG